MRYVIGFVAGVLVAIAAIAVVMSVVHMPGPPDQQAGFEMGMVFLALPILAIILGLFGATVASSLQKKD
jgi:CDP-diglyceride synthetase